MKIRPPRLYVSRKGKYYIRGGKKKVYITGVRDKKKYPVKQAHAKGKFAKIVDAPIREKDIVGVLLKNKDYYRNIKPKKRKSTTRGVHFQKPVVGDMVPSQFGFVLGPRTNTEAKAHYKNLGAVQKSYQPIYIDNPYESKNTKKKRKQLAKATTPNQQEYVKEVERQVVNRLPTVQQVALQDIPVPGEKISPYDDATLAANKKAVEQKTAETQTNEIREDQAYLLQKEVKKAKEAKAKEAFRKSKQKYKEKAEENKAKTNISNLEGVHTARDIIAGFLKPGEEEKEQVGKEAIEEHSYLMEEFEKIPAKFFKEYQKERGAKYFDEEDLDELRGIVQAYKESLEKHGSGGGKYSNWKQGLYDDQIEKIMESKTKKLVPVITPKEIPNMLPYVNKHTKTFGFILNEPVNQHWKAVWIDIPRGEICYYDSLVSEPSKEDLKGIKMLVDKIDPEIYLKMKVNRIKMQNDKTEDCGWYSMKFILDMIKGKKFKDASGYDDSIAGQKEIQRFKDYI